MPTQVELVAMLKKKKHEMDITGHQSLKCRNSKIRQVKTIDYELRRNDIREDEEQKERPCIYKIEVWI